MKTQERAKNPETKKRHKTSLFALHNARTGAQLNHMAEAAAECRCVFCDIDWKVNTLLRQGKYWRVMLNAFPYPAHRNHIILTPIRHVTDITKLKDEEWTEWQRLNCWAIRKYKLPGGGIVMRFGDFRYSAGTVAHLHSHIQVPNRRRYAIAVFCKDADFERFSRITNAKWRKKHPLKGKKGPEKKDGKPANKK